MLTTNDIVLLAIVGPLLIIAFVYAVYRRRKLNWLHTNGKEIIATVTDVTQNREPRRYPDGRIVNVYTVKATWTDPQNNSTYTFRDNTLDQSEKFPPGSQVSVLIDPQHPQERYSMQLHSMNRFVQD
jgi:hypothetical protein